MSSGRRIPQTRAEASLARSFRDLTRPAFHEYAACRGADVDEFYPSDDRAARQADRMAQRRETVEKLESVRDRYCRRCPVQLECLTWAVVNCDDDGIRAGIAGDRRAKMRRLNRSPLQMLEECGMLIQEDDPSDQGTLVRIS